MLAGVTIQCRLPGVTVAGQSNIEYDSDTARTLTKTLTSLESFTWTIGPFVRANIALLFIQSRDEVDITINGDVVTIMGSKNYGIPIAFCNDGSNAFGELPFASGDVTEITIENMTTVANQISVIIASVVAVGSGSV